jgi:hypothetical protein
VVEPHELLGSVERIIGVEPDHMIGRAGLWALRASADPDCLGTPSRGAPHGVVDLEIVGRSKGKDNVARAHGGPQGGNDIRAGRDRQRRQGPLPDDDGVHELNGDVMSMKPRRRRGTPKGAARREPARHGKRSPSKVIEHAGELRVGCGLGGNGHGFFPYPKTRTEVFSR